MSGKAAAFVRCLAYAMEIVVVYVLGSTPGLLPEIYGAKPALLLCAALTAAIFEKEIPAMIIGLCCGVLMDLGYSNSVGFFSVALTVVCFVVGYAANNLIVATFPNFLIYSFISVGGLFFLYFAVTFLWGGVEDSWVYFTNHIVSRMVQTFLFSMVFYVLNRIIYQTLGEEN